MGQPVKEIAASLIKAILLSCTFFAIMAVFFFFLETHLETSREKRIREKNMSIIHEMLKKRNKSE